MSGGAGGEAGGGADLRTQSPLLGLRHPVCARTQGTELAEASSQGVQLPAAACWLSAVRKAPMTSLVPALREAELSIHSWGPLPQPADGCQTLCMGLPAQGPAGMYALYDVGLP